jgi:hypothetical protein
MIDVLKQALEALQKIYIAPEHEEYIRVWWPACEQAITSLRQAIAEAEKQEPVAMVQDLDEVLRHRLVYEQGFDWKDPLYASPQPPQQAPVKLPCCGYYNAEAVKWNPYNQVVQCHNCGQIYTFPQPTQQEPVAWRAVNFSHDNDVYPWAYRDFDDPFFPLDAGQPLYTSPQHRQWVGLTDEEIWNVLQFRGYNTDTIEIAKAIEAKLKEKNT